MMPMIPLRTFKDPAGHLTDFLLAQESLSTFLCHYDKVQLGFKLILMLIYVTLQQQQMDGWFSHFP